MRYKLYYLSILLLPFLSCNTNGQNHPKINTSESEFNAYWFQGKAEISSYELEQARYGEIHQGDAVLIFVTEDFSKSKQVKLDNPEANKDDAVKVLKLNLTKKFNTGIYPYSMMQSIFTPLDLKTYPYPLKVTASSQEWCGHTFTQFNLNKDNTFTITSLSYFESEGDETIDLPATILEDEIWTIIKINPNSLPIGKTKMIPGSLYQRLRHTKFKVLEANTKLEQAQLYNFPKEQLYCYSINYPELDRELKIYFTQTFPFSIVAWEETYESGWGATAKTLTTKAYLKKTLMIDYWNKHDNIDLPLRKKLGLD